jgi:predicted outer membrane repeat protein
MIGTLFVGAPGPVRATADDIYIGFNAHTSGGSCTDPDFTADGDDDSAQIALAVTDTNASGTLHFCPGTYDIDTTIDLDGTDITLQGANASTTILDGGDAVQILTSPGAITVSDLTFHNGNTAAGDADNGGAIYADTVTVTSSTFTSNTADYDGGAIYADNAVTVTDSSFTGNISDDDGGAIYADTVTVTSSTFTDNTADGYGGAMKMSDHGSVVTSRFVGNRAFGSDGGAIQVSGNLDTVRSYFANNSALDEGPLDSDLDPDSGGGALWVGGEWTDLRSTFVGNWAGYQGGAVFAQENCVAGRNCYGHSRIVGTVFRNNFARQGGGAIATDFGDLSITGARFIGNSTLGWGGALLLNGDNMTSDYEGCAYSTDDNCSLTVTRTQFSRNRAPARQASVMVMANVANSRVVFKGCRFRSVRRDSIISTFARVRGARHIVEGEYLNP